MTGSTFVFTAIVVALALVAIAAQRLHRRHWRATHRLVLADTLLILHASQTGTARGLAHDTAELLRAAGRAVRVRSLGEVTSAQALAHRRVLLVLATCGDGDPPQEARPFADTLLPWRASRDVWLDGVSFGLLALGDRRYSDFCGFALHVEHWLRQHGARPLFERVEVDGWDGAALERWQAELAAFGAGAIPPAWRESVASPERPWRLVERRVLNPGSVGEPLLHLELEPADGAPPPAWEAGDLARVRIPGGRPGERRERDYSVASVPSDGRLHLVVRVVRRRNGQPGVASGWFADAPVGSELGVQLVAHPSFRRGDAERPLVLIGTGAGIAGLRGHWRAPAEGAGARHWLVFGERQRAHDHVYADETGALARADLAFSRDEPERPYIQHRLRESADALRQWVADGAAIYVCGTRSGMAEDVHDALVEILGDHALGELAAAGRYRRDVY